MSAACARPTTASRSSPTRTAEVRGLGASRHWLIWGAVVPVALWAIVRALGLDSGFPLIPLLAHTPYVAAAALLITGVAVALSNWAASLVATAATALLLAAVVPRAFGGP